MHLSCDFEHIAFVGGPCSGKTSVFEALRALPVREESNACLSFVGEAATQILPRDPTLSRRDPLFFQFEVSLWQYMEEDRGFERLISCCDKPLKVQITETLQKQIAALEKISGITIAEAKDELLKRVEGDIQHETALKLTEYEARFRDEANEKAKEILTESEIDILVSLNSGTGKAEAWGCDLTYDYVKINGDYRT